MRAYSTSVRPTVEPSRPRRRAEKIDAVRDVNQHVARRLKMLRLIKGRTQSDLGAAMGLTHQQMAKYERGFSKIAPGMLWKLADYFQVDVEYFFADLDQGVPDIDPHVVERQATQRRLRLELVAALDTVTDERLLRSLRVFLQVSRKQGGDE